MGSWFVGSWVHGFMGSWVHGFMGSWVHGFVVRGFMGSWFVVLGSRFSVLGSRFISTDGLRAPKARLSSRAGGWVGKRGTSEAPLEHRFSAEARGRERSKNRYTIRSWEVPRVPATHPLGTTELRSYRKRERYTAP
jgi:hypothetical protein